MTKSTARSRSLQIYMKPGIREDNLLLEVWDACDEEDRPQNVFRMMLRRGLMAMVESGEMPEAVVEKCGLDLLLEKRKRRSKRLQDAPAPQYAPQAVLPGYPAYAPPYAPPQAYPQPAARQYRDEDDYGYEEDARRQPRRPARAPERDYGDMGRDEPEEPATRPQEADRRALESKTPQPEPPPPAPPPSEMPKREEPARASEPPAAGQKRKLGAIM